MQFEAMHVVQFCCFSA